MKKKLKCYFLKYDFFKHIQRIYLDLDCNKINTILLYFRVSKILLAMKMLKHDLALKYSDALVSSGYSIGAYYKASILFLLGKDCEAKSEIEFFLDTNKFHANGTYLYASILTNLNNKLLAWDVLERLLIESNRKKTWQYLSKLISNNDDFKRFEQLLFSYYPDFSQKIDYGLLVHYTDAAYRCNQQQKALYFWELKYKEKNKSETGFVCVCKPKFTIEMASVALNDIKKCLDRADIPFFLISGTLLGCIREGALLGHDKDIDLGVWDSISSDRLILVLRKSGCFHILPSSNKDLVVVRHVNGVSIDLFIHYREENDYYHKGVKCVWHNTPFTLKEYIFLGGNYLIPDDYELYLQENYGDWKSPKIDFDSALDTPNMSVFDSIMMKIYIYKKLILYSSEISDLKKEMFLNRLKDL